MRDLRLTPCRLPLVCSTLHLELGVLALLSWCLLADRSTLLGAACGLVIFAGLCGHLACSVLMSRLLVRAEAFMRQMVFLQTASECLLRHHEREQNGR